jgi:hypothetical protein
MRVSSIITFAIPLTILMPLSPHAHHPSQGRGQPSRARCIDASGFLLFGEFIWILQSVKRAYKFIALTILDPNQPLFTVFIPLLHGDPPLASSSKKILLK